MLCRAGGRGVGKSTSAFVSASSKRRRLALLRFQTNNGIRIPKRLITHPAAINPKLVALEKVEVGVFVDILDADGVGVGKTNWNVLTGGSNVSVGLVWSVGSNVSGGLGVGSTFGGAGVG